MVELIVNRNTEADAVSAFVRACDAGLGATWFTARYPGTCMLTHATIRPGHQIAMVLPGKFVRRDAIEAVSIRGNETIAGVLDRFAWADKNIAAAWIAEGDSVLLLTGSTLKPKVVGLTLALGGCATVDKVNALFWRQVAFMLRKRNHHA